MRDEWPLAPAWRFKRKNMAGYISGGHEHGVEISWGSDKKPVTRRMCLNLEHYFAHALAGFFVPRKKAAVHSELRGDASVGVVVEPYGEWRVRPSIAYSFRSENTIEAECRFAFEADYRDFNALISNYFHEPTEPWVHVGGEWLQPAIGENEHRIWARDDQSKKLMRRQMTGLHAAPGIPSEFARTLDERLYDYPVMVSPIRDSGWSIIHIVDRETCPSISANRRYHAHDFTLVGRDVASGETVTCRAWMVYEKLEVLDSALAIADQLRAD